MIEVLVKYIQDKGYMVKVLQGVLLIRKRVKDQLFGIDWAISNFDFHPDFEQYLYDDADVRLEQIEKAIAEHDTQPHETKEGTDA